MEGKLFLKPNIMPPTIYFAGEATLFGHPDLLLEDSVDSTFVGGYEISLEDCYQTNPKANQFEMDGNGGTPIFHIKI